MAVRPLFNGKAMVSVHDSTAANVSDYDHCLSMDSVAVADINLRTAAGGNLGFRVDRGTTITFRFRWDDRSGAGTQDPTQYQAVIKRDDGTTELDNGLVSVPAENAEATFTHTFTRGGTYELYLFVRRFVAALVWSADTEGALAGAQAGVTITLNNADKGRMRVRDTLSTFSNTRNDGTAIPANNLVPPDVGRVTRTFAANTEAVARDLVVRVRDTGGGTIRKTATESWNDTATKNFDYNADTTFPLANTTMDVEFLDDDSVAGGRSNLHNGNTPQYTGLADAADASGAWAELKSDSQGFIDFKTCRRVAPFTVDPRVRWSSDGVAADGVVNVSESTRLYNRGESLGTTAQFNAFVLNARLEQINVAAGSLAPVAKDDATSATEGTVSVVDKVGQRYRFSYAVPSTAVAANDLTGTDKRFECTPAIYGSANPTAVSGKGTAGAFKASSKIVLHSAASLPSGDPAQADNNPGVSQAKFNRSESATLTFFLFFARGAAIASLAGFTSEVLDTAGPGGTSDDSQSQSTNASGRIQYSYTVGAAHAAALDTTGRAKHVKVTPPSSNTVFESASTWRVSRLWRLSKNGVTIDDGVKTGKTAGADDVTSRNRGQTLFFDGFLYNVRGELQANATVNWNVRPSGAETVDQANATRALASGRFQDSYTVAAAAATGTKTLLVADATTTGGTNQPRTGTAGSGNFAESSTGTPEWSVSSTYTVESRTQKTATRTSDPEDTQFTIGEDTVYAYAQVADTAGDAVNGARLDLTQIDPTATLRQTVSDVVTASNGWTTASGFDTRTPKGTGWVQRATVTGHAANNGNTGTNDQSITLLSAFTADKNLAVGVYALAAIGRILRERERYGVAVSFYVAGAKTAVDTSPAPTLCLARKRADSTQQEYLQANGTYALTPNFFQMVAGADANTWVATVGPGETIDVPIASIAAGEYTALTSIYYQGQRFVDDERFKVLALEVAVGGMSFDVPAAVVVGVSRSVRVDAVFSATEAATLRVFRIVGGVEVDDLAEGAMTTVPGLVQSERTWTPSAPGTYTMRLRASVADQIIQVDRTVLVV